MHTRQFLVLGFWISSLLPLLGQDRSNTTSSFSVEGAKKIVVEPTRLRLQLEMQAEGRTAVDAMRGIAEQRKKVREALQEMKSDLNTLEFSSTNLIVGTPGLLGREASFRANGIFLDAADDLFGAPNELRPKKEEDQDGESPLPKIHFASETATVEWELPTKDLDALMVLPESLKGQVKKRDLKGRKNRVKLNDEERDQILAEIRKQGMTGEEPDGDDEVEIKFFGLVSDEQYKKGVRDAFASAQKEASLLAEATGQKLGKVIKMDGVQIQTVDRTSHVYQSYGMGYPRQVQNFTEITDREVASSSAERMKAMIRIQVTFSAE